MIAHCSYYTPIEQCLIGLLDADVRKGRGKPRADKMGRGRNTVIFADVLYGGPLVDVRIM